MSLKTAFLTFKKSYTSYPNWGGGNLDKIQKKSNFFSWNPPLLMKIELLLRRRLQCKVANLLKILSMEIV